MEKCDNCSKTVYQLEKLTVSGILIHKSCFKCYKCSTALRLNNYSKNNGKLWCQYHYKQLFLTKGNYEEGFGLSKHTEKWIKSSNKIAAVNKI